MFDLGMGEIIIIAIVAILVLGPEQMPKVLYNIGKWMRQFSYTRFALERQFENFMTKEEAKETADKIIQHDPAVEAKLIETLETPKEPVDGPR